MTIRPADIVAMANRALLWSTALVVGAALTASPVSAKEKQASGPVACSQLAADPALGLVGNKVIKSVDSTIIQATGPKPGVLPGKRAVRRVAGAEHQRPRRSAAQLAGWRHRRREGAWNGRTQGIGGGGCAGSLNVTAPVNAGYVGSGTDTGHTGGDCEPGVNPDGTYNLQFIQDFIRNAIKQQVLLSKVIARRTTRKARLRLLERLLDRRATRLSACAGARQRARRRPRECPGDLLDAIPDGANVGSDRHEGPDGRSDCRGQAQPDDRLGGRGVRRRRWRGRRRDRRSPDVQVQRDGEHLRHARPRRRPTA